MSHPIQLRRRARQRAKRRREERMAFAYRDPMLYAFGVYADGSGYLRKKPERMAVEARGEDWFPIGPSRPEFLRFPKVWGPPVLVP